MTTDHSDTKKHLTKKCSCSKEDRNIYTILTEEDFLEVIKVIHIEKVYYR